MKHLIPFLINNRTLILLVLLLDPVFSWTQPYDNTGLLFDREAYEAFPLLDEGRNKNIAIPHRFSLKPYCPFPQSQGSIASCVGWAVGYGAMTIHRAYQQGVTDRAYIDDQLAYSASFVFNQIKKGEDCGQGASIPDALQLVRRQGDCLSRTFPNSTTSCKRQPSPSAFQEAEQYRLGSQPYRIFRSRSTIKDKITATKIQIANGVAVIVGFSVTPVYRPLRGKSLWQPDRTIDRGHAMVVVGYDDRLQSFELMNCFGPYWGDGGFIWITYEDFAQYAREAYVLEDGAGGKGEADAGMSDLHVQMSGSLSLEYANPFTRDSIRFEPVRLRFLSEQGGYSAGRQTWKKDEDLFRLTVDIPRGRFAYLFTIDREGQADSIWSMTCYHQDTTIKLPTRGYYQFSKPGEEWLCLLVSYEKIDNFGTKLHRIYYREESKVQEKIAQAFGEAIIRPGHIQYEKEQAAFQCSAPGKAGIVAPLILSLHIE